MSPKPKPHSLAGSSSIKYKGVRKRMWGKWVSEIRLPNSRDRIWLGSCDSADKAARAFDTAQFCLRGRSPSFNFPDNPPDIPGGRSLSHAEIQAAAARFANSTDQVHLEDSAGSCWDDMLITDHTNNSNTMEMDNYYPSEYGIFQGFDDLSNDFYVPTAPLDENFNGDLAQEPFLWSF